MDDRNTSKRGVFLSKRRLARACARKYSIGLLLVVLASICIWHEVNFYGIDSESEYYLQSPNGVRRLVEPEDFFTQQQRKHGAIVLHCMGLLYMFAAIALVCDECFVPALEVITEVLDLSPDVAGATFMAAGGSAPEFITSLIGAMIVESDVGTGTIIGSAAFNVLVVIGACAMISPEPVRLSWFPLARDSCFYAVDLGVITVVLLDNEVRWFEALVLFLLYVAYGTFMAFSSRIEAWANGATRDCPPCEDARGDGDTPEAQEEENEPLSLSSPDAGAGIKDWLYYVIMFPILFCLVCTIPNVRREGYRNWFVLTFIMSICWITAFTWVMVWFASVIGETAGIGDHIMGLTILAAGTSVPDMLTSLIVARQGHGDMAVSSSIGSNIFDVTVGLPIPWLVYCAYKGRPVKIKNDGLVIGEGLLLGMVFLTICPIMLHGWVMTKWMGGSLLVLYVIFEVTMLTIT